MKIIRVKGNTYCIDSGLSYIPFYKINETEIILLDSGLAHGQRKGLDSLLESEHLTITGIISSHAHIDHVGNNAHWKEKYNCKIAMSEIDAIMCRSAFNLKISNDHYSLSQVEHHFGNMICDVDLLILESQKNISLCGVEFRLFHTPGHSVEHLCIITPDDVGYLGDTLMSYETMRGAKIPYAYVIRKDFESKMKLLQLPCSQYIVAHKGIYQEIDQLVKDNIAFFQKRNQRILELIEGDMTLEEIVKIAIAQFHIVITSINKYQALARMIRSHVDYLFETKKISQSIIDGYLKYTRNPS